MKEKQNLYFIATIPPQKVCNAITEFKKDIASRFQSIAALKTIPHITLKAPFKLADVEEKHLMQWFKNMDISVSSFEQELKDFGAFRNRRNPVVHVKPIMNSSLHQLQKEVIQNFINAYSAEQVTKSEIEFNPHITIAYRDLQPAMFKQAWTEYRSKKYSAIFEVKNFTLLQHDGKVWNSVTKFPLESSVQ